MKTVGMGVEKGMEGMEGISVELKESFDGLLAENEKLHSRIGELEEELKTALAPKEPESKSKK